MTLSKWSSPTIQNATIESLEAPYWPNDIPNQGSRQIPFAQDIYIEREDFTENPPKGFKRLSPGEEVRLRYAYVIKCNEVIRDSNGLLREIHCTYDPQTLGKNPERKIKGAIHWLAAKTAVPATIHLYDKLFSVGNPDEGDGHFTDYLNPDSLIITQGFVEPSINQDPKDQRYQFERQGYFVQDQDSSPEHLIFNRIVALKDSFKQEFTRTDLEVLVTHEKAKVANKVGDVRDPSLDFTPEQKAKLELFLNDFKLLRDDGLILASDSKLAIFFENAVQSYANPTGIAHWVTNDLRRELKGQPIETLKFLPADLAHMVQLIDKNIINNRIAKDLFIEMFQSGKNPGAIVKDKSLEQVTDLSSLEPLVLKLIAENPDKVEAYKNGKTGLLGFFVGQVMRETGGKANPQLLQELVRSKLK